MRIRTKMIVGLVSGIILFGSCSSNDSKQISTTTTTPVFGELPVAKPTTTTTAEPVTTTTAKRVTVTIAKPVTTTTAKRVTVTTAKPVTTTTAKPVSAPKQCYVNGYTKSNGTQVAGYYRSC